DRAPGRCDARRWSARTGCARHRRAGARGSEVSPGGLLQDQLVEREIRDGLAQARILGLQRLHALDLVRLQAAVLLAPAIVRDLGDPNRADRVRHWGSLCDQHIDLAQLGNDLFGGVSLLWHRDPPSARKPYFRMDHSTGGGSGSECARAVLEAGLPSVMLKTLAAPAHPIPNSRDWEASILPNEQRISEALLDLFEA